MLNANFSALQICSPPFYGYCQFKGLLTKVCCILAIAASGANCQEIGAQLVIE